MRLAIYPGTFDPITLGHLDICQRASGIFDQLIVCVMVNAEKNPLFSVEERVSLIRRVTAHLPNVVVDSSSLLLAEYAAKQSANVILRGLRVVSDYERECQMALINKKLNPELDTFLLPATEKYTYLSSTIVKEVARYGGSLEDFVPKEIMPDILNKIFG